MFFHYGPDQEIFPEPDPENLKFSEPDPAQTRAGSGPGSDRTRRALLQSVARISRYCFNEHFFKYIFDILELLKAFFDLSNS
jgi:hypothetical protein